MQTAGNDSSKNNGYLADNLELVVVDKAQAATKTFRPDSTLVSISGDCLVVAGLILLIMAGVLIGGLLDTNEEKEAPAGARTILTSVPTIGILSKPLKDEGYDIVTNLTQVVEAKYARYIEGGGAKPIYINYEASEDDLRKIFKKINGLFLIGGNTEMTELDPQTRQPRLSRYTQKVRMLLNLAREEFDSGGYFPVWGTCQGYELLLLALGDDPGLLRNGCKCVGYNAVLNFSSSVASSRMCSVFSQSQRTGLANDPMTYNNHDSFVTEEDILRNKGLAETFRVLSTSGNHNGSFAFVSAIEGKQYPFYGVQFHPEKNAYDFNPAHPAVHSLAAIQSMQAFSVFFANEARYNSHAFDSEKEETANSVYHGKMGFESHIGALYLYQ